MTRVDPTQGAPALCNDVRDHLGTGKPAYRPERERHGRIDMGPGKMPKCIDHSDHHEGEGERHACDTHPTSSKRVHHHRPRPDENEEKCSQRLGGRSPAGKRCSHETVCFRVMVSSSFATSSHASKASSSCS